MLFSEYFEIEVDEQDTWFDPFLHVDTRLFIDPFLIFATEEGEFEGTHAEIIAYFNRAYELVAEAGPQQLPQPYTRALGLLTFPEVNEFCLGYAEAGRGGAGSGKHFAKAMASAIWQSIRSGATRLRHFEEVGILQEGIGADRISDATAGVIRHRLMTYTEGVCERHGVETETFRRPNGRFDIAKDMWVPVTARLPRNPYTDRPLILVPQYFLRSLPALNADEFWNFCWKIENDTLRAELNSLISRGVNKSRIIEIARKHPEVRREFIRYLERNPPVPYDVEGDPHGLLQWYKATKAFCEQSPLHLPIDDKEDFFGAVKRMISRFRHFVVQQSGWKLLYKEDAGSFQNPKNEGAAQKLFQGIVANYCAANDIDVSPETDIGRGPVDFKVSKGHKLRALVEVKLAKNTKFWNGLTKQLPTYLKAEKIEVGHFIVFVFNDKDK